LLHAQRDGSAQGWVTVRGRSLVFNHSLTDEEEINLVLSLKRLFIRQAFITITVAAKKLDW